MQQNVRKFHQMCYPVGACLQQAVGAWGPTTSRLKLPDARRIPIRHLSGYFPFDFPIRRRRLGWGPRMSNGNYEMEPHSTLRGLLGG